MNPYSPISWLYVYGFLGQNSKNRILRLFLDIWKSGSVCEDQSTNFDGKSQIKLSVEIEKMICSKLSSTVTKFLCQVSRNLMKKKHNVDFYNFLVKEC